MKQPEEQSNGETGVNNSQTELGGEVIFEYKGLVYNRPLGRGIMLLEGERKDLYLDEVMPEDRCEIEIIVRKPARAEATKEE